jgi:hypothetical protein
MQKHPLNRFELQTGHFDTHFNVVLLKIWLRYGQGQGHKEIGKGTQTDTDRDMDMNIDNLNGQLTKNKSVESIKL